MQLFFDLMLVNGLDVIGDLAGPVMVSLCHENIVQSAFAAKLCAVFHLLGM